MFKDYKITIVKLLPKETCKINVIPVKISITIFYAEILKIILKSMYHLKGPQISKTTWGRRKNLETSPMLISKHTTKLQYSKQYGIDIKEDTQANGKE